MEMELKSVTQLHAYIITQVRVPSRGARGHNLGPISMLNEKTG